MCRDSIFSEAVGFEISINEKAVLSILVLVGAARRLFRGVLRACPIMVLSQSQLWELSRNTKKVFWMDILNSSNKKILQTFCAMEKSIVRWKELAILSLACTKRRL